MLPITSQSARTDKAPRAGSGREPLAVNGSQWVAACTAGAVGDNGKVGRREISNQNKCFV
eukprot:11543604-Alexandrium_andersonii.AAC.1